MRKGRGFFEILPCLTPSRALVEPNKKSERTVSITSALVLPARSQCETRASSNTGSIVLVKMGLFRGDALDAAFFFFAIMFVFTYASSERKKYFYQVLYSNLKALCRRTGMQPSQVEAF